MIVRRQALKSWHQSKAGFRAMLTQHWCPTLPFLVWTSFLCSQSLFFRANLFHSHFLIHYFTAKGNWILFFEILVFCKALLIYWLILKREGEKERKKKPILMWDGNKDQLPSACSYEGSGVKSATCACALVLELSQKPPGTQDNA